MGKTAGVLAVLVALGAVATSPRGDAPQKNQQGDVLHAFNDLVSASAWLLAAAAQFNGPAQLVSAPGPGGEGISIEPDDSTVTIPQGGTVDIVYALTRLDDYAGTVTPYVSGLPTGVTGEWSDSSMTGGDAATTLTLTAASDAPTVTADAFVVTFSGAGVDDATDNGTVTVTASVTPLWEVTRNFNSGADGGATQGQSDGFDDIAGQSLYSDEQVAEGALACKMSITSGSDGFGNWGGVVDFPSNLVKGDVLWGRLNIYIPASFVIDTSGNTSLKTIRIRQQKADTTLTGHIDIQMRDDSITASEFRMIKETQDLWLEFGTNGIMTRDVWHEFAYRIEFDDVLPGSGGNANIKFWLNGVLLVSSTTIQTLYLSTDEAIALFLFTYWNGLSPQTQSLYVDDIRMAAYDDPAGVPSWATSLEGVS